MRDSAEIVWPLDDITDSSSVSKAINFFNDLSGSLSASVYPNNTNLLKTPIVFGGGTLLSFTSSAVGLSIPALGRFSELYENKDSTISIWFQASSTSSEEQVIFRKRNYPNIGLFIKDNYLIFRYGNSASYNQVAVDFVDIKEPHNIVISRNQASIKIILDGVSYLNKDGDIVKLEKDNSHNSNDYIDFYGPKSGYWNIDCPSIYPNSLTPSIAKRHYVYGLGKNIPDKLFYSRGGNLYNLATIYTERLIDINWDYPDEWKFSNLIDINNDEFGVGPLKFNEPIIYSIDNRIDTSTNKYKFSSSVGPTQGSYIDVDKLFSKVGSGDYPILAKFKLDGVLPEKYLSQSLMTMGRVGDVNAIKFDIYNNDGNYQIRITANNISSSVTFNISNITSSPSFYVGMKFSDSTSLYFAQSGSAIQTASFNYVSASGFGLDPLTGYFPPTSDSLIRIGSELNYDSESFASSPFAVNQFLGSFERFLVAQPSFSSSLSFFYIENYNQSKYEFTYDSSLKRFKVRSYGYGDFNIHSVNFSEYIDDDNIKIGGNYIGIGYPDLQSSSVYFYATLFSYSGSVVQPRTRLNQHNYLGFLNNTNLSDQYIKFDFELYSNDTYYYPPRIKYFKMQTFKNYSGSVKIKDDAGTDYTLFQSSSSIYLPESRYTPTIFMTEESGVKVQRNKVEFTENIISKPLDPRTIPGIKLWLDSRFINGLNKVNPEDDSRILRWVDLSNNSNDAVQTISASAPVFRNQSLNLFRVNQSDGAEGNDLSFIIGNSASIESSIDGSVSGTSGIKVTPNGSSIDSYIDLSFNTASISVFPGQSYTVVGSIKLDKPQTASSLHQDSRKIIINNINNGAEIFAASSNAALNLPGIYSLSAVFITASSTSRSVVRFYNGSSLPSDYVYWDNLGLYPVVSGSAVTEWKTPLTTNDSLTVKFNGLSTFLTTTASLSNQNSIYIVARNFGDSIFLQSTTASLLYSNSASYFLSSGSPQPYQISNNKFNLFSIIDNGTSASLFINGIAAGVKATGTLGVDRLFIGRQLRGDICSLVAFEGINSQMDRLRIENWLTESFKIS